MCLVFCGVLWSEKVGVDRVRVVFIVRGVGLFWDIKYICGRENLGSVGVGSVGCVSVNVVVYVIWWCLGWVNVVIY